MSRLPIDTVALSENHSLVSPMSPALTTTISAIESAFRSIATGASTLGATTANLPTQRTYVSNLSDSLTTGVGALVGANMNEAATKLAGPQREQQSGARALSISNSNTKLILKLFEL